MNNSKIIQLLNANDTHDIAMILLATDRILKKQFVEHLVFVVLKSIFCDDCRINILGFFFAHHLHSTYSDNVLFCNGEVSLYFIQKKIRYRKEMQSFKDNILYDLCNPEECIKITKKLENVAYSCIDWWYKYYITKELR